MAVTAFDLPKPARRSDPVGSGSDRRGASALAAWRQECLRRRRRLLETFFSPLVAASPSALPSTVDRLVLWRSRHGRHHS
ncbi:hypothetical protein [Actomonas aquatica]|uniref:Uncharacterized protein n=1 Tax=Actomonas aquatica TaxID=2866162 RepID=A0ABZ1CBR4_9BACT|nr:hypothetical protein [Opitutus sp. WL0086]WRQ89112.1 hypothetical protein K1X11_006805 [Opitutus sp. WL0086]